MISALRVLKAWKADIIVAVFYEWCAPNPEWVILFYYGEQGDQSDFHELSLLLFMTGEDRKMGIDVIPVS